MFLRSSIVFCGSMEMKTYQHGYLNILGGVTNQMDESTSFEMIDRIIQESIRPVLKADGGDITLVDFSDGVVKIALEKTRVPVTFSKFLVTFKVMTGCSCGRCRVPSVAIRDGVLKRLKEEMPGIRGVEVVH